MSRLTATGSGSGPHILPPIHAESKRDKKRRETINKIEVLHDESWRTRDEKFSQLYKEYHNENQAVNSQPPTSAQYLLRIYPISLERDALLEATEIDYQYKRGQAQRAYEAEREGIEGSYWDARDQVKQRLLGAIEERRRKLREEKEGGDVITEVLLEAQIKSRPVKRMPFRDRIPNNGGGGVNGNAANGNGNGIGGVNGHASGSGSGSGSGTPPPHVPANDVLLHSLLAPALTHISTDDILAPSSTSLAVQPAIGSSAFQPNPKRGPRGKDPVKEGEIVAAPGTATALAVASGQQRGRGAGAGASQGQWVLGKSLAELKKMESATTLEIESDWARIQGTGGRGRRNRGD